MVTWGQGTDHSVQSILLTTDHAILCSSFRNLFVARTTLKLLLLVNVTFVIRKPLRKNMTNSQWDYERTPCDLNANSSWRVVHLHPTKLFLFTISCIKPNSSREFKQSFYRGKTLSNGRRPEKTKAYDLNTSNLVRKNQVTCLVYWSRSIWELSTEVKNLRFPH